MDIVDSVLGAKTREKLPSHKMKRKKRHKETTSKTPYT